MSLKALNILIHHKHMLLWANWIKEKRGLEAQGEVLFSK